MDFNEGINELNQLCKGKEWFFDIGTDPYGRYVVYVHFMCPETQTLIPDKVAGRQVLVHFAASKTATREKFTNNPQENIPFELKRTITDVTEFAELDESEDGDLDDRSLRHLLNELDRLEKQCGSRTFQDIFYEIHDKKNAVTNFSLKYPDVRRDLERLYDKYGFDVIYENIDG